MQKIEFVAELSANHLGSLDRALEIVDAAAEAGATAFKLQTWKPDTMCINRAYTLDSGPWKGRKLFDLYREAWTPWEWHDVIFDYARSLGMTPFSAAFDTESVDFLETLWVDRHKVASFELTDHALIRRMAKTGKPIILSTGMATAEEIDAALDHVTDNEIMLLACTSAYPASPADANLSTWVKCPSWGLSDHTLGVGVAAAAVSLGATYIEKHLSLDHKGLDGGFSAIPGEFAEMVKACTQAAQAIGIPSKLGPGQHESTSLRRSLWAKIDIAKGDKLQLGLNIVSARPALGIKASRNVNGYKARIAVRAGEPITQEVIG